MAFTPNHQQKVNDCYPRKEGEGCVTGKLSSLIYYINARPQKLVKVSAYLSSKVAKDVSRQKDSYNIVTLEIVEVIMKNCSSYFETFCPSALSILYHMLQSPSYPLALRSLQTFSEFCNRSKNIIGTLHDESFFRSLNDLTSYFAKHSVRNQDSNRGEMWQAFGFQGLNLIIGLEDFKNDHGSKRVKIIIDTVWAIMKNYSDFLPNSTERSQSDTRYISDAGIKCISVISNLLTKSSASTLPVIINSLFEICDRNGWAPKSLCMFLFGSVALNVPSQFLFVVISSIFRHFDSIPYRENEYVALMFCIYQILQANRSPLGFSAIELTSNILSRAKIAASYNQISLPIILSANCITMLPESISMCVFCLMSVFQNSNFMTQRYDILTYVIRKNFRLSNDLSTNLLSSRDVSISDKQSIVTETVNPASFQFLQIIWVFLSCTFSENSKTSKFSLAQSPSGFFEKLINILKIEDRDTSANCLHIMFLMMSHNSINLKELLRYDDSIYFTDHVLMKIYECLLTEYCTLPHFVLSYRILRFISKSSKILWIRSISMIRSLRKFLSPSDPSKIVFCTFIECLLIEVYAEFHSKIESFDFKDLQSEVADCQVYVDLFEFGEVSALNKSFGNSHFDFDFDVAIFLRIYKTPKLLTTDEFNSLIDEFRPTAPEIKERNVRAENRQLLSFEDSFKAQYTKNQEISSKRSILSINLGSSSSRSLQPTSPKPKTENGFPSYEYSPNRLSEESINRSSNTSINVLSSEFDSLSIQAKAEKSSKNNRKTILE